MALPITTEDGRVKDWKTFQDPKDKFEIKYPSDWYLFRDQPTFVDRRNVLGVVTFSNQQKLLIEGGPDGTILQGDPHDYYEVRIIATKMDMPDLNSYVQSLQAPSVKETGEAIQLDNRPGLMFNKGVVLVEWTPNIVLEVSGYHLKDNVDQGIGEVLEAMLSTLKHM